MIQVYGNLPKSQIDNETIEEMIDRKISEHEASATAHMGTGESIDVHRKTEIVDHLAGSILSDKFTMSEFQFTSSFKDMSNFENSGVVDIENFALYLYVEYGVQNISKSYIPFYRPSPFLTTTKDFLFQCVMQVDKSNSNGKIYIGNSSSSNTSTFDFFGFEVINGVVKAMAKSGATILRSSAITVNLSNAHIYRMQYIDGENKFYYYIDGQLVAEIENTLSDPSADGGALFYSELTASNDGYIYILDLFISKRLV